MGHYFSDAWTIAVMGRHRTTIMRWRRAGVFPPELVKLARLELDGELGLIDERFAEFTLCRRRGVLLVPGGTARGPERVEYTPGELKSLPWRLAQLRALELERGRIRSSEQAALERAAALVCEACGAPRRQVG